MQRYEPPHPDDRVLTCHDCGERFVFPVAEQEHFQRMAFQEDPIRCIPCRRAKRQRFVEREQKMRTRYVGTFANVPEPRRYHW